MLYAQNSITIGKTMYQNQSFTAQDKQIFDADKEGSRVWQWSKAQNYCKKLKLDGYDDWRVSSQGELQAIMTKKTSDHNLYIRSEFSMPATGGKYDDVWMWTRDSHSSKLGTFVNFKKAKSGKADKGYKGYVLCTRSIRSTANALKKITCKGDAKQELTYSTDWSKAWSICGGYIALKKDGSLWQFGKMGECNWGQMMPIDPQTGKPMYENIYYLNPKKIGDGFDGAKIINGIFRLYAIKKDGTLWGWGEELGIKPKKLTSSRNWADFGVRDGSQDCYDYDIGLKKDGTLWQFPKGSFQHGKYKTSLKLQKVSQFSDWNKITLGCGAIYGVRKNGTLWKFDETDGKSDFKRFTPKKGLYTGDEELYSLLKTKMSKIKPGTVYSPDINHKIEVNRDGTLCLWPEVK